MKRVDNNTWITKMNRNATQVVVERVPAELRSRDSYVATVWIKDEATSTRTFYSQADVRAFCREVSHW